MTVTSGDWDGLNDQLEYIARQLLRKVDDTTISQIYNLETQFREELTDAVETIQSVLDDVESAQYSLRVTLASVQEILETHTGLTAYSGHYGGLTGEAY